MTDIVPESLVTDIKFLLEKNNIQETKVTEIISLLQKELPSLFTPKKEKKSKKKSEQELPEFEDLTNGDLINKKDNLMKFNNDYLKNALNHYGLKKTGKKNEMVDRLWEYISATDSMEYFCKNDNSRIKKEELKDEFGEGVKYKGVNFHEFYYSKVFPMLKKKYKPEKDIEIGEIREEYIGYNIKKDSFLSVWCNEIDSTKEFKKYVFQIAKKGKNLNININSLENIDIDVSEEDDISFHSHVYDKINNENICHIYS